MLQLVVETVVALQLLAVLLQHVATLAAVLAMAVTKAVAQAATADSKCLS